MRVLIAAVVSTVALLLFVATAAGSLTERGFGLTTAPADSCELVVMSAGDTRSGLGPGDMIETKRLDVHKRLHLMVTGGGDSMEVPAMVRGAPRMVTITPMPASAPSLAAYLRVGTLFVLLAIGLFALWRGRDGPSLGLGLFFAAIPSLFFHHAYPGLPDTAIIAVLFLSVLLAALAYLGLYGMIEALADDAPGRRYFTLARAIVAAALGIVAVTSIASISTQLFSGCSPLSQLRVVFACYGLVLGVSFLILWSGMTGASPTHRRRLGWIFWSTLAGYAGPLVTYAYVAASRPIPFDGLYNVGFLAIPLGYSYAVLRHRVIDVGFVLNRALVYTLLTTVVVGAFTLTETFATAAALGNTESALLKIAVPLAVGLSFNMLHRRVERGIEAFFFRGRHRAQAALTSFADQADRFESASALEERTVDELLRLGGIREAAIYRRVGDGLECTARAGNSAVPLTIGPADSAFAAIAGTTGYVDVEAHAIGSVLQTGCVFPLRWSNRLEGALVVQPGESGEEFTPDELQLFAGLAKKVATVLAGLQLTEYGRFIESLTASDIDERIRTQAAATLRT